VHHAAILILESLPISAIYWYASILLAFVELLLFHPTKPRQQDAGVPKNLLHISENLNLFQKSETKYLS
jgi:hypothetical protein